MGEFLKRALTVWVVFGGTHIVTEKLKMHQKLEKDDVLPVTTTTNFSRLNLSFVSVQPLHLTNLTLAVHVQDESACAMICEERDHRAFTYHQATSLCSTTAHYPLACVQLSSLHETCSETLYFFSFTDFPDAPEHATEEQHARYVKEIATPFLNNLLASLPESEKYCYTSARPDIEVTEPVSIKDTASERTTQLAKGDSESTVHYSTSTIQKAVEPGTTTSSLFALSTKGTGPASSSASPTASVPPATAATSPTTATHGISSSSSKSSSSVGLTMLPTSTVGHTSTSTMTVASSSPAGSSSLSTGRRESSPVSTQEGSSTPSEPTFTSSGDITSTSSPDDIESSLPQDDFSSSPTSLDHFNTTESYSSTSPGDNGDLQSTSTLISSTSQREVSTTLGDESSPSAMETSSTNALTTTTTSPSELPPFNAAGYIRIQGQKFFLPIYPLTFSEHYVKDLAFFNEASRFETTLLVFEHCHAIITRTTGNGEWYSQQTFDGSTHQEEIEFGYEGRRGIATVTSWCDN